MAAQMLDAPIFIRGMGNWTFILFSFDSTGPDGTSPRPEIKRYKSPENPVADEPVSKSARWFLVGSRKTAGMHQLAERVDQQNQTRKNAVQRASEPWDHGLKMNHQGVSLPPQVGPEKDSQQGSATVMDRKKKERKIISRTEM
jgi:hypothetical protein